MKSFVSSALSALTSSDPIVRCDAISDLASEINNAEVKEAVSKSFYDKNYLVRCEAYEAFYGCEDEAVFEMLLKRLKKEKSSAAKMYLCMTLGSIIIKSGIDAESEKYVFECYKKEKSKRAIISFSGLMYIIKKDAVYVDDILSYLSEKDYHIRCNVINTVADIISVDKEYFAKTVMPKMKDIMSSENSAAVSGCFEELCSELKI